jgi:hypothetical protein
LPKVRRVEERGKAEDHVVVEARDQAEVEAKDRAEVCAEGRKACVEARAEKVPEEEAQEAEVRAEEGREKVCAEVRVEEGRVEACAEDQAEARAEEGRVEACVEAGTERSRLLELWSALRFGRINCRTVPFRISECRYGWMRQ